MNKNIILNCDSYKMSHFLQYPPNTTRTNSYIESRGGRWHRTLFMGLQMFIKEYLTKPITKADIDEAEAVVNAHGVPFNRAGWEHILNKHGGYLPVEIEAIREGTVLPTGNALVQVRNTDPECFWLTSYIETAILRAVWYPTTVATQSFVVKQIIKDALEKTGTPEDINFKLHDFGARGASSLETAGIGGCAHLVNFMGSDTLEGVLYASRYYGADMAGFSIPASEHSTITSWGQKENEVEAFKNMLKQFGGKYPLFAVVSDSYDVYNAAGNIWGDTLLEDVQKCGSTVVVRPDSGNPIAVVCRIINILGDKFGWEYNSKGFKVLPKCVRVIQGDGVNEQSIRDILFEMQCEGLSADNIAFGMGGALLQHFDRDTFKFAMKCSAIERDNHWHDVFKDPITDVGKRSKRGRLSVVKSGPKHAEAWSTNRYEDWENGQHENQLEPVYRNGEILREQTFAEIRELASQYI